MTAHLPSLHEVHASRVAYVTAWLRVRPGDTEGALAAFAEDFPTAARLLTLVPVFHMSNQRDHASPR